MADVAVVVVDAMLLESVRVKCIENSIRWRDGHEDRGSREMGNETR